MPMMMITPKDVTLAVTLSVAALSAGADKDWQVKAGSLDWTCWETAEHLADDLFAYAIQFAASEPPQDTYVPVLVEPKRDGGPGSAIWVDPKAGVTGLLQTLDACGGLLASVIKVTPASARAFHSSGLSNPEGYAAMGITETLLHTYDIATGLELPWEPPADLCKRVLDRLFRDVPTGFAPWETMLWCSGRIQLPGHPRLTQWRIDSTVR